LYGPIKGQRRASRKGRGWKKDRGEENQKKNREGDRERERKQQTEGEEDHRRGATRSAASLHRHPLRFQQQHSQVSWFPPAFLITMFLSRLRVKKKRKERGKPGYWLGPVTRFEPAGPSPACTAGLDPAP
jgi:hypothetical protein